jgi:hypothetical protein
MSEEPQRGLGLSPEPGRIPDKWQHYEKWTPAGRIIFILAMLLTILLPRLIGWLRHH